MRVLLDTNILLRFVNPRDPSYETIRSVVRSLVEHRNQLCLTPQNLVEFWNVSTRPAHRNGLGATVHEADERAKVLESEFRLLPDTERVQVEWRRLVVAHGVCGVQVHDARLVAAMLAHGVRQLLTLNDKDFKRYHEISVLHPRDVVPAQ